MTAPEAPSAPCPVCTRLFGRVAETIGALRRLEPGAQTGPGGLGELAERLKDEAVLLAVHVGEQHETAPWLSRGRRR